MNPELRALTLGLASYALLSTALAAALAFAWHAGASRRVMSAGQLLRLRLMPSLLGATLTAGVVLPSFLRHEPSNPLERVGPVVLMLALGSAFLIGHGLWRAWQARVATRRIVATWSAAGRHTTLGGTTLDVIDVAAPIVALVGLWRPRVVVARAVVDACTPTELAQVAAHEHAHRAAGDNVKRLLMLAAPDVLAWLPLAATLLDRWHLASEEAADAAAVGDDRQARLALASALIKVARLATQGALIPSLVSHLTGLDGIERRVRRLLSRESAPCTSAAWLPVSALVVLPWLAIPFHSHLHAVAETLISLGR